ncbi:Cytochrome P450 domain-containing protein [Rozella allomycis CSF55]|uniref:Cytochrome P450 domain-containing protein n=1 Tax=Rozella allomycis (strain CSF55) TaxID=988480 RepID=A0A075APD7_ROZAC|nr:Cytochrome P450 domain-containing protein [Rozella allomycis CSF55]|eukprot:EPZ31936.1 Cytochrome P450 domain-containing protein [Rozella allomycis CSF55]
MIPIMVLAERAWIIDDPRLLDELTAKPETFGKLCNKGIMSELRKIGGDGLFTSADHEENWGMAHRILIPAFSQKALRVYIPEMCRQAKKLLDALCKGSSQTDVDVPKWMTKITIETISMCGFSYAFHGLDKEEDDPFVKAMGYCLEEVQLNSMRTKIGQFINRKRQEQFDHSMKYVESVVKNVIEERRKSGVKVDPNQPRDFLDIMLSEGLRMYPSAGAYAKDVLKDDSLGGVPVKENDFVAVSVYAMHFNTTYWGDDAEKFNPDRFNPEEEAKRHPSAYSPFGSGPRACLGAQFALLEARIILAYIYYHLHVSASPNAVPRLIQKTAFKPERLYLRFKKRTTPNIRNASPFTAPSRTSTPVTRERSEVVLTNGTPDDQIVSLASVSGGMPVVNILYGSNMGTCEEMASNFANHLRKSGANVEVRSLDNWNDLEDTKLAIIITSTYNGLPPDNAKKFDQNIKNLLLKSESKMKKLRTFQAFPKYVDKSLYSLGGIRIMPKGEGNVDDGCDIEKHFSDWQEEFWKTVKTIYNFVPSKTPIEELMGEQVNIMPLTQDQLNGLEIMNPCPLSSAKLHKIEKIKELQSKESSFRTLHVELALQQNQKYSTGDHFGIVAPNSKKDVLLVLNNLILPESIHA